MIFDQKVQSCSFTTAKSNTRLRIFIGMSFNTLTSIQVKERKLGISKK